MTHDLTEELTLALIMRNPGISDREIAEHVFGPDSPGAMVNGTCRALAGAGKIRRHLRGDGLLGSWVAEGEKR